MAKQICARSRAAFTAQSVQATALASDPDGIASARFKVGSGAWVDAVVSAGTWSAPLVLAVGVNTITFEATDANASPRSHQATSTVTYSAPDNVAPTISIDSPSNGATIIGSAGTRITVSGQVTDNAGGSGIADVKVNDTEAIFDSTGAFSAQVTLVTGPNTITISAVDSAGNAKTAVVSVQVIVVDPTSGGNVIVLSDDFQEIELRLRQRGIG